MGSTSSPDQAYLCQVTRKAHQVSSKDTTSNDVNSVISVFDYEDYHVFFKDWSEARRRVRSTFSFQELANRAGLKSRSFLRKVSIGEKDLLHAAALRLTEAMDLPEREAGYFLALVGFNNATDPKERDIYLRKLRQYRRPAQRKILSAQEFDFFGKWYVSAIWEVVTFFPFGDDFRLLGKVVQPAITADEARHALKVLLDLGLIEPAFDRYVQTHKVIHTRDELISKAIKSYQIETLTLAARALESIPVDRRHISTLTLGLDAERWKVARQLTHDYRQKLIDLGSEPGSVDRVYQFNLQAFPLGGGE